MNWSKKLTQGIILTISALSLACTAALTNVAETPVETTVTAQNGKAGIVASLEQTESRMLDEVQLADVTG